MLTVRNTLLAIIGAGGLTFAFWWARTNAASKGERSTPTLVQIVIGFITNFFDTLGIGSFATTTAVYKMLGLVPDEKIPGTMIIGHALPVVAQALTRTPSTSTMHVSHV